jgi:hypothetical protein
MSRDELYDFSRTCSMNDETEPNCWKCRNFIFPIGCMLHENEQPPNNEEDAE